MDGMTIKRYRIKSDSGNTVAIMHAYNHYGALKDFQERHSGFDFRWTNAVPSTPYLVRMDRPHGAPYILTAHRTI